MKVKLSLLGVLKGSMNQKDFQSGTAVAVQELHIIKQRLKELLKNPCVCLRKCDKEEAKKPKLWY